MFALFRRPPPPPTVADVAAKCLEAAQHELLTARAEFERWKHTVAMLEERCERLSP